MAENDSILGVVIDPGKAVSGSNTVNKALDSMESKGDKFAQKFDSTLSNTFDKFAQKSKTTFDRFQTSASASFDRLVSSTQRGADRLSNIYAQMYNKISAAQAKFNKQQLNTSQAALFQGPKLATQTVSYAGTKNEISALAKAWEQVTAKVAQYKQVLIGTSGASLLKAPPNVMQVWAATAIQAFERVKIAGSKLQGQLAPIWSQIATSGQAAFSKLSSSASSAATSIVARMKAAAQSIKENWGKGDGGSGGGGMFDNLGGLLAGAGLFALIDQFISKLVDVSNTYNSFLATLKAGNMTTEQAGEEYNYLLNLANSMGVEFASLTRSYAKFTAAVSGTVLEGKAAKEVFESIVSVSTVLHAKGYDTERMFYAITQSISKGRLYREELVQQLAEKLPGAMKLAAKSMGMEIKELNKRLTDGSIDVNEFWLRFSQGLKESYGPASEEAAKMVEANINRLRNAVTTAFINIGQSGAIEGFIKLVQSLTDVINSVTSSSTYFGETVGNTFSMIADWINTLSPQDIDAVFQGLTGVFDALILSTKVFVESISDVSDSKGTFIDFAEASSKALLTLSGILADTVNVFKLLYTYMNKPVEPKLPMLPGLMAQRNDPNYKNKTPEQIRAYEKSVGDKFNAEMAQYSKDTKAYDKKIEDAWDNVGKGLGNADAASKKMEETFNRMREHNAATSDVPFSKAPRKELKVPQALPKDELQDLLDKITSDPSYGGGGKADKGVTKKQIMRAYFNERESQIKSLAKMQIEESNILKNLNPLFDYNVRLTNEKIEADERLSKLLPEYKDRLLDGARAMDAQAIALENTKARMTDYMATYQQLIALQEQTDQLNDAGPKQFNEQDKAKRATMFGGADYYLDDASKAQKIKNAGLIDNANIDNAAARMGYDFREDVIQLTQRNDLIGKGTFLMQSLSAAQEIDNNVRRISAGLAEDQAKKFKDLGEAQKVVIDQLVFQSMSKNMMFDLSEQIKDLEFRNQLIGKTALEQAKLNEQYRIDQVMRRETKDMTDEQKQKYIELANVIKGNLNKALEESFKIQRSGITGIRNAIADYTDDVTDYAAHMYNTFSNMFHSVEDLLVDFLTTGKASFSDFLTQIKRDIARTFVKEQIMAPIMASIKAIMSSGGNQSGNGQASGGGQAAGSASGLAGIFGGGSSINISSNMLSGIGSGISKLGSFFGSAGMASWGTNFANGAAGMMTGASAGMGPTVAGAATGIGSQVGNFASSAGKFMSTYGGYISAGIQLLQGNVKGAAFTAAGAAIGSIIPGIGTLVGAAVGSMIGGLFGGGVKTQKFSSAVNGFYSNGKFTSSTQSGTAGYKKALGAEGGLSAVMEAYSKNISDLMTTYGLSGDVSTGTSMFQRSSKKTRAWGYFGASAGGGSASFSSGDDPFPTMQAAFEALVEKIMTQGITSLITSSKLPQGIRDLFAGLTDKTQIQTMLVAVTTLKEVESSLTAQYNLTADTAGRVAVATGLAGENLIKFLDNLMTVSTSLDGIGITLVRTRDKLLEQAQGSVDIDMLPDTMKAFDLLLKNIDTNTSEGIQRFADLFQIREAFAQYTQSIDGLKNGVNDAIYAMVSPTEQLAIRQANLAKVFEQVNMAVPGSIQELIDLGKSIDFTTAEGLSLAAVFPTLVQAFSDTQAAAESLINTLVDPNGFRTMFEYTRAQKIISRYGVKDGTEILGNALPSFDVGTNFVPYDMVANIHRGERIIPAADNAKLIGGQSDVSDSINGMREEQRVMLISMTRSLASIERKIAKIDKLGIMIAAYDQDGNPTVINVKEVV